jgi:thiosulfate dehydrogenase
MAKQPAKRSGSGSRSKGKNGGSGPALAALGVVAAVLAGGTYLYQHTGSTAVTPAEPTQTPRSADPPYSGRSTTSAERSPSPPPRSVPPAPSAASSPVPPFGTSEEVFEGGARLYAANCAGCHGRPGKDAKGPLAAQFWNPGNAAGAHAVAHSPGALYQAIATGNLVQGMPSYGQRLTDTQIWDLTLLLRSAHDDLPEPVLRLLRGGL